jgi:folylpolyglutamate synthase/dihydropteroate synthase
MQNSKINPSLVNIKNALALRSNPQDAFKSIVVGGTNGKGSVCSFLELLYLHHYPHLKIAKYISPHLVSICERFSVDGKEISPLDFECYWQSFIGDDPELQSLTPFEKETLFAFEYFKMQKVDVAILEVGMGGIWDATNTTAIEQTLATAITNISFDHMEFLGNTLEEIKKNKEGIIKPGVPHFNGTDIEAEDSNPNSLRGVNFLLALKIFQSVNQMQVDLSAQEKILRDFPSRYQARLQIDLDAKTLIDIAHNPASMTNLNSYIKKNLEPDSKKIFVIGMLDKDYKTCLDNLLGDIIKQGDEVIFCEPDSPRKTSAELLLRHAQEKYPARLFKLIKNPSEAIARALESKTEQDWLVVTGSTTIIACAFKLILSLKELSKQ